MGATSSRPEHRFDHPPLHFLPSQVEQLFFHLGSLASTISLHCSHLLHRLYSFILRPLFGSHAHTAADDPGERPSQLSWLDKGAMKRRRLKRRGSIERRKKRAEAVAVAVGAKAYIEEYAQRRDSMQMTFSNDTRVCSSGRSSQRRDSMQTAASIDIKRTSSPVPEQEATVRLVTVPAGPSDRPPMTIGRSTSGPAATTSVSTQSQTLPAGVVASSMGPPLSTQRLPRPSSSAARPSLDSQARKTSGQAPSLKAALIAPPSSSTSREAKRRSLPIHTQGYPRGPRRSQTHDLTAPANTRQFNRAPVSRSSVDVLHRPSVPFPFSDKTRASLDFPSSSFQQCASSRSSISDLASAAVASSNSSGVLNLNLKGLGLEKKKAPGKKDWRDEIDRRAKRRVVQGQGQQQQQQQGQGQRQTSGGNSLRLELSRTSLASSHTSTALAPSASMSTATAVA